MKLKEIDLYITERCNLECSFCSIKASPKSTCELSIESICNFITYCKSHGVTDIHITGGEPTLHKDYKAIIDLVIKNDIDARLITNGILLTQQDFDELKSIGLKNIMFSLDGLQEFHDSVRQLGAFNKTMNSIRIAAGMGFNVRVNTVAWNENLNEIVYLLDELNDLCIDTYSVFLGSPVGRAKYVSGLTVVNARDWECFINGLKSHCIENRIGPQVVVEQGYVHKKLARNDYVNMRSCSSILENTNYLSVRADGNIYPCVFFSNDGKSLGNIYDLKNLDIEQSLKNDDFYNSVSLLPSYCFECDKVSFCKGGCRGFNFAIGGELKDLRCNTDEYIPICPLIKLDLFSGYVAPCTDDLIIEK